MNLKQVVIGLVIICNVSIINAEDLGVVGKTYPIGEQSLLEYIKSKAAKMVNDGSWEKYQQSMIAKTEQSLDYPPVIAGVGRTTESSVRYFDPSIRINENIVDPYTKTTLATKGQVINPTSYANFNNELIFIDGRDPAQIQYALTESNKSKFRTSIVLIAAVKIRELMKKEQHIFYYDQGGTLVKKFNIRNVPTIIYQDDINPKMLRVEEVKI